MPPPAAAPPIRIDRQADYKIVLGDSITGGSGGYNALKYNHKPSSFILNPSSPSLTPSSTDDGSYELTFTPPTTTNTQIHYSGTARTQQPQHFLLFDPQQKVFRLERLDAAFVFNADVYAKLHPPIDDDDAATAAAAATTAGSGGSNQSRPPQPESEAGGGGGDDEGAGAGDDGIYDFRRFMGRTTAAEEKRQKRLGALKRAGKEVVELPEEDVEDVDGDLVIPDAPPPPPLPVEEPDAEGESDDDDHPPPPPPPPPQKRKAAPKPKSKKKQQQPPAPPPPPPAEEVLVIPDPIPAPPVNSDDEDLDFSEEEEDEFNIEKELEEALEEAPPATATAAGTGTGTGGTQEVLFEDEEVSDEDEDPGTLVVPPGTGVKSLREMFGVQEDEEEDSESESEEE